MFTGNVGNKRRVNLGGSSKGAESREQILERSRVDRERRKQNKLEHVKATLIQVGHHRFPCPSCLVLRA